VIHLKKIMLIALILGMFNPTAVITTVDNVISITNNGVTKTIVVPEE
jgi:hypothetical protein